MKHKIIKELVSMDGITAAYKLTSECMECGQEYTATNIYTSMYCQECKEIVRRRKTRERVQRHRERKRIEESTIRSL